jgi:hypothetical protein
MEVDLVVGRDAEVGRLFGGTGALRLARFRGGEHAGRRSGNERLEGLESGWCARGRPLRFYETRRGSMAMGRRSECQQGVQMLFEPSGIRVNRTSIAGHAHAYDLQMMHWASLYPRAEVRCLDAEPRHEC